MKEGKRIDNLSLLIYIIHDLILEEYEEKQLLWNIQNNLDTDGIIKIKATRTSEIDLSLEDKEIKEYEINTKDIAYREIIQ